MIQDLQELLQPSQPPKKIYGWMHTQLSVARHYGGCTYQGHSYKVDFNDLDQPLVRQDVMEEEKKAKKMSNKKVKPAEQQGELPI